MNLPVIKSLRNKNSKNRKIFIAAILIWPIIQWLVFWVYVNFNTFVLAFKTNYTNEWTVNNFVVFWDKLTSPKGEIKLALINTARYFVTNLILLFLNLVVAYFLYKRVLGSRAFRIIFYLPGIVSGVAMTTVYMEIVKPTGPLGVVMNAIGLPFDPKGLFNNPDTATPAIIAYCVWTGFTGHVLMFQSSLSRIPTDMLESARLDGIGPWRELTRIIIPLIWPMITTMLILSLTGLFGASGPILLFAPNGEANTTTLSFWIFKQVYGTGATGGTGAYGVVSAAGLCFTAVALPIILSARWLAEKVPSVEY